jgi:hypothetical protein
MLREPIKCKQCNKFYLYRSGPRICHHCGHEEAEYYENEYYCEDCDDYFSLFDASSDNDQTDCPNCSNYAWLDSSTPLTEAQHNSVTNQIKSQKQTTQKQFKMENLKVEVKEGTEQLIIRHGEAEILHETQSLMISGSLETPQEFFEVREDQLDPKKTHIIIDEDKGTITVKANDQDEMGQITVVGTLKIHPDFIALGINNTSMERSPLDLAKFIKMNRTLFESKAKASELISVLRNFEATIEQALSKKSDDRGNYAVKRAQAVDSNLPETFKVMVPLFIGEKPSSFEVEIIIDPDSLNCTLISPDAADSIKREKKAKMDEQVGVFADQFVIVNV